MVSEDLGEAYDEGRLIGFAPIRKQINCVTFIESHDRYRVIIGFTAPYRDHKHEKSTLTAQSSRHEKQLTTARDAL